MTAIVSFVGVLTGSALAQLAQRLPMRTETVETAAGAFLICGLALLGVALPGLP